MAKCDGFKNFKQRGEWVEAQFIAQALRKHFKVLKPWGDSSSYDVCVEYSRHFLRVQVKSTSYRLGTGYQCAFQPNRHGTRYTTKTVDFFAAYVIPENVWYVIPSAVVLKTKNHDLMLCPVRKPRRDLYRYETYREAWTLLKKWECSNGITQSPNDTVEDSPLERRVSPNNLRAGIRISNHGFYIFMTTD